MSHPATAARLLVDATTPVATVTINHDQRRNAFDAALLHEFVAAVESVADRPQCTVVVIRSAGAHFCAGWDTNDFARLAGAGPDAIAADLMANHAILDRLWRVPAVTLAAVRGSVAGFGVGLLTRLHLAIASTTATLVLPEARYGIAAGGVLIDVQRALPSKVALDLLLTGDPIDAAAALRLGLVSRVVADDALDTTVDELAARIAGHPGAAVATVLDTFRDTAGLATTAAVSTATTAAARTVTALPRASRPPAEHPPADNPTVGNPTADPAARGGRT